MYVWVILATFLAMIASYTLTIRPDAREITIEPLAEAALGRIVAQHKAAERYALYHRYPHMTHHNYRTVEYVPGLLSDAELQPEMPIGYNLDNTYRSKIFCLSTDYKTSLTMSPGGSNPCDDNEQNMMVTYGAIPQRWLSLNDTTVPSTDLLNAMGRLVASSEGFGYIARTDKTSDPYNPSGSSVQIVNNSLLVYHDDTNEIVHHYLPAPIVNDNDFRSVCNLDSGKGCLVYVSTI